MKITLPFLLFIVTLLPLTMFSQNQNLVEIERIRPDDVRMAGFQLETAQKIKIEAAGVFQESQSKQLIVGYPWILKAESREVVWEFQSVDYEGGRIKTQEEKVDLELPAGVYEVYYASYPYYRSRWGEHDDWDDGHGIVGHFFEWLFWERRHRTNDGFDRELYDNFKIIVQGNGNQLSRTDVLENIRKIQAQAAVSLKGNKDEIFVQRGFEIKQTTTVNIYCIGEAHERAQYDFGWIVDLNNRQRLWQLDYRNSEHAGGADKNRMVKKQMELEPGKYAAVYVTDDSHSPREWNSPPASDPYFWGLTITAQDENTTLVSFEYTPFVEKNVIVSMTKIRDDQFTTEGFTLKKPMKLHIYSLGEGRDGDMFDYGWIIDAQTRKKVWKMSYRDTEHAGGAMKNRLYDGVIDLPAGNYLVYYVTDGSHSYRDWNTSPPYNPVNWGITVSVVNGDFDRNNVSSFQDENNQAILAKIARVRNDENIHETFSLTEAGKIRIYALGEGSRGRMYDYGWIEDKRSGKVIWEMSYRITEHAGGARKNRIYNDLIQLESGEYRLYYESDDSHAFSDWNDTPPNDPVNWGITLFQANQVNN